MQQSTALLNITDASGKTVISKTICLNAGINTTTINGLSKLSKGTYLVHLINNGENITASLLIGN